MISVALVRQNLQNEKQLHPLSVQDFDEIALVTSGDMISIAETIMTEANVEVQKFKNSKGSKCAVLYDRSCNKELHTSNLCAIFLKTFLKWAKKLSPSKCFRERDLSVCSCLPLRLGGVGIWKFHIQGEGVYS